MDKRKEFCRKLAHARDLAFSVDAILDRLEAEMDKDDACWGDVGMMGDFCHALEELMAEVEPYVEQKLGEF